MEVKGNIKKSRGLKDFTRLLLGLCLCLFVLSFYQQLRLWQFGVIDTVFSTSSGRYLLHQLGFSAFVGLVLAFVFRFLEAKVAALGFRVTLVVCLIILIAEVWLIEYFIRQYELMDYSAFSELLTINMSLFSMVMGLVLALLIGLLFWGAYKITKTWNRIIGRMYPLTIVFFVLFLGTFFMEKQPINQNKVQFLITDGLAQTFDAYEYKGNKPYPLVKRWQPNTHLDRYFELKEERPNVVLLVLEDLGADFLNPKGRYTGFTPFLDSLSSASLCWNNFLSNTLDRESVIPSIVGSLPNGASGFLQTSAPVDRNTLFGLLKANGYSTAFYSGHNTSLTQLDRFLEQEQVHRTIDKSDFGEGYHLLQTDQAGNTLGYPDKEVYKKWQADHKNTESPRFDVILNTAIIDLDLLPEKSDYLDKLETKLGALNLSKESVRFIEKNKSIFAARLYSDDALKEFFQGYKTLPEYQNTIFLITGNKNSKQPNDTNISPYHVPFIVYSPLLTTNARFKNRASHHDVAPSILSLLHKKYSFKLPEYAAWLGSDVLKDDGKTIALYRNKKVLKELITENHFISAGKVHSMDAELGLSEDITLEKDSIKANFKFFKAMDRYVLSDNKLLPDSLSVYKVSKRRFTNEEKVWVQSVFNGRNFDNAYATARKLAHKGNTERALLLCAFILSEVPGHIDAQVLEGRIYAWSKDYPKSMATLEATVRKYPHYHDAYAALLDVYFWSGKVKNYEWVVEQLQANTIEDQALTQKIERLKLLDDKTKTTHPQISQLDFETTE